MSAREMTARALQSVLVDAFNACVEGAEIDLYDALCAEMGREGDDDDGSEDFDGPALEATSYRDAGVLTQSAGLVLRIGSREFQVTIVRSR